MSGKYAPANDKGEKPYIVERAGWGRRTHRIAFATKPSDAKWEAFGRMGVGEAIVSCRRATHEDMKEHGR